jgi:DNA-binding response OmpR family regulator
MPLVLLVEDEETLRRVLRNLLERDGFEVAEAGDGAEALSAVDRLTPDAVVLDLNLPVMDGYDVLSRLRTRSTSATLPVLVLTANGDEASEVRALKMGANEFLTKPFRPRALAARLKLLLARDG